jgi:aminoglycoside 6'-N-acetyltransferase I
MALAGRGMRVFFPRLAATSIQYGRGPSTVCGRLRFATLLRMLNKAVFIERCSSLHQPGWLDMRVALWSDATADEHRGYMAICLAQPERFLQLMMYDEHRRPIGFIEGSIRSDYVNGTETSPVGFVEGVYVTPAMRRQGVARRLYAAIGDWAKARGCRELASDALLDNESSQRAHQALGFQETERVVYFTKKL